MKSGWGGDDVGIRMRWERNDVGRCWNDAGMRKGCERKRMGAERGKLQILEKIFGKILRNVDKISTKILMLRGGKVCRKGAKIYNYAKNEVIFA